MGGVAPGPWILLFHVGRERSIRFLLPRALEDLLLGLLPLLGLVGPLLHLLLISLVPLLRLRGLLHLLARVVLHLARGLLLQALLFLFARFGFLGSFRTWGLLKGRPPCSIRTLVHLPKSQRGHRHQAQRKSNTSAAGQSSTQVLSSEREHFHALSAFSGMGNSPASRQKSTLRVVLCKTQGGTKASGRRPAASVSEGEPACIPQHDRRLDR